MEVLCFDIGFRAVASISEKLVSMEVYVPSTSTDTRLFNFRKTSQYGGTRFCTGCGMTCYNFRKTSQYGGTLWAFYFCHIYQIKISEKLVSMEVLPRLHSLNDKFLEFQKNQLVWRYNTCYVIVCFGRVISEKLVSMEDDKFLDSHNKHNDYFRKTSQYGGVLFPPCICAVFLSHFRKTSQYGGLSSFLIVMVFPTSISEKLVSMEVRLCSSDSQYVSFYFRKTSQYGG